MKELARKKKRPCQLSGTLLENEKLRKIQGAILQDEVK